MKTKLKNIYHFLKENRKYNKLIQVSFYESAIMPYDNTFDKVYSLLFQILNSQSQLNMDKSAEFFKRIASKKSNLESFSNFLKAIGGTVNTPKTFKSLFELLSKQPSWGNKTAALFVKAVYHCHIGYSKDLKFWDDIPSELSKEDEIYLPVDAVIYFIFETLGNPCSKTFWGINKYIKENAPTSSFDIWDDLWFWGFITQQSKDKTRVLEWNENKYWNLQNAKKDSKSIEDTMKLANQFITLLKQK